MLRALQSGTWGHMAPYLTTINKRPKLICLVVHSLFLLVFVIIIIIIIVVVVVVVHYDNLKLGF